MDFLAGLEWTAGAAGSHEKFYIFFGKSPMAAFARDFFPQRPVQAVKKMAYGPHDGLNAGFFWCSVASHNTIRRE
ncbi:MAG: hypothetical protein HDQ92_01380 [Desulfovibrio sp.]|nr:hypothetical protein [Desulfovibrio sp.]